MKDRSDDPSHYPLSPVALPWYFPWRVVDRNKQGYFLKRPKRNKQAKRYSIRQDNTIYKPSIKLSFSSIEQDKRKL